jgi:Cu(I)/Ag(I) efflux system membrane fusion protein
MKRSVFILAGIVAILAAVAVGYLLGRLTPAGTVGPGVSAGDATARQIYTCSMHPQVRLDRPGKCPICEMPLIPAGGTGLSSDAAPVLTLSEHALAMAGVETTAVAYRELSRHLRAVGKVQYNEPSLATVTARVDGYAEKLFVNVTGVTIKAGDHLAEVYSPDLVVAQQELLIALQDGEAGPLVETAKLKLRRWGLTEKQVDDLVDSRKATDRVTLYSPTSGTVIEKMIVENSVFKAGDVLYRIADLDTVWVYLDIYEADLAWVRFGQAVELVAEAYPGQTFTGKVTFVEPVVNEQTRTVRVPVHVENPGHTLKPGMYVSAVIRSRLGTDGRAAPTGVEGKFTCPMHPQVLADAGGACPLCGMPLEQIPAAASQAPPVDQSPATTVAPHYVCPMKCEGATIYEQVGNCPVCQMRLQKVSAPAQPDAVAASGVLAIPVSAVLDSGTRRIVYVERNRGTFEPREVTLGPRTGEFFPVIRGVTHGERVVTRGGFLIDSQFQITGHPSLYYPGGLRASPEHPHEGTEAASDTQPPAGQPMPAEPTPQTGAHKH